MPERKWTREQKQAIEARGGTLLVSAAAGSGKTAVLVERVITRLTDPDDPCDADRMLIVTFTNAAAAEMRERISLRLADRIAENPMDENLRRQQILLQSAHISTIHAFCLDLIREHFEQLDVAPDFRVADENETNLLLKDALDELLEEKYESGGKFLKLCETLGAGRDDSALEDTILRLYNFLRSLPDPETWLDGRLRMYNPGTPVVQTLWGRCALAYVKTVLSGAISTEKKAIAVINGNESLQKAYGPAFEGDCRQLESALSAADGGNWDAVYQTIQNFSFERLGGLRKFDDDGLKESLKDSRADIKKTVEELQGGVLCCDGAGFESDLKAVYPVAESLFETAAALDKRFFAKKSEKGVLDFGDLEHLALRLLVSRDEDGALAPTSTALAVSRRFEEVLVDEYQDTNPAQDAIFRAVSQGGKNLFLVGDVKQSIYRFRKATPELFMEKKERFHPFDGKTYPAKILLGRNFRSRVGITAAVNFIFRQLMTRSFGEIDYGAGEELVSAAEYPERGGPDFALHIVDTSGYEGGEDADILEARHIAKLIAGLAGKFPVKGERGLRPAQYRDFCILLRSANGRAEKYSAELESAGIPVYADMAGGYLGSYEVAVMISLLRILDNPLQDVPLLSVMLSPVFGFTPDDLARIRVENRKGSLYLALCSYASREGGKFSRFLEKLGQLRALAAVLPADRLILRIYAGTGFLNICEAMPAGSARRANLRLLLDYARSYESAGYRGLAGFIRFIDRVGEQKGDFAPASSVPETADVVRIMSIHKSKGLEFPICILAGCSKRFNREDTQRSALFHPVYGFGSVIRDQTLNCRYTTLPREVVKLETEKSGLSEEMRVLYVAMTRAKERLYCVTTLSNPASALQKAASLIRPGSGSLDPLKASRAQSFSQWLLACALRHPSCAALRAVGGIDCETLPDPFPWEVEISKPSSGAGAQSEAECENTKKQPDAEEIAQAAGKLRERLSFAYPCAQLSRLPSKVAVSELAEKEERASLPPAGPAFLAGEGMTAAQKGTALHVFMQYADFSRLGREDGIRQELERLTELSYLLPGQAAAVDTGKVNIFVNSKLYADIRSADRVYRELRFNLPIDASDLNTEVGSGGIPDGKIGTEGETVVLQGMADIVFWKDGNLYLADYKTDNADGEQLRERYARQLALYARAVSEIFEGKVAGMFLYGFRDGVIVKL